MAKVRIIVKQIKNIRDVEYAFMWFDYAKENGFNKDDYQVVFDGEIEVDDKYINNTDAILETAFEVCNLRHQEGYKGHSLSVSDIVEYNGVDYYVDNIGFVKLD